ncbi:MAG: hypothetical protein ACPGFA_05980 [Pikeienuella sp.]
MNGFAVLIRLCGLDVDSATYFLGLRRRVIANWAKGGGNPTDAAIAALSKLHQQQQKYADDLLEAWDEAGRPATMAIEVSANDAAARERGWPSVRAQLVAPVIAQTYLSPARVVFQQEQDANAVAAE